MVATSLRSGTCPPDAVFDAFLPSDLQKVAWVHWTPLLVARRVAEWFALLGVERVVDLGSGAGKFCVAASLLCDAHFLGIEHRARLVHAARDLAQTFGVSDRVRFVHATIQDDLPPADAYYLYNPFGENLFGCEDHLDQDVEISPPRHTRDVETLVRALDAAPAGTIVVTLNGIGGGMPFSYVEIRTNRNLPSVLRMFKKTSWRSLVG